VPALIEEAIQNFDDPEGVIEIDLDPSGHDRTLETRMNQVSWHVIALATLSECYQKQGQMTGARTALSPVLAFVAEKAASESPTSSFSKRNTAGSLAYAQYVYWKRLADLDEHENKKEDALNDYRQALLAQDTERDTLLVKQRRLWKDLGRSDEAWQAWVDSIQRPTWEEQKPMQAGFAAVHRVLPNVALKDLNGNEWSADRLMKTTIAVVWATWCEPCRKELPYFAKLADQLKGRTDVQVISFDTDENPETAKQFVEKSGYSFPVLSAKNFAEDLMPYLSIPRTWIIRDGVIVQEIEGFGADGDQWVERVAAQAK